MRNVRKIYVGLFALLLAGSVGVGSVQAYQVTDCGNGNIGYGSCDGFNKPDDMTGQTAPSTAASSGASSAGAAGARTYSQYNASGQSATETAPEAQAQPEAPAATPTPVSAKPDAKDDSEENKLLKLLSDWLTE